MRPALSRIQLDVLDGVVAEGTYGGTRADVLRSALADQAEHLQAGGGPFDTPPRPVLEVDKPTLGPPRLDITLRPVTGKAVPVHRGQVLRITQLQGGQCIDLNGYNLRDHKEYLDNGFNRINGMPKGKGSIVWSGSPRARPMYALLDCSQYLDQFYAGHRCNATIFETLYGYHERPNCQDTFSEAIREYGLTPDDVHDSFNLWMTVTTDQDGRLRFPWNRAPKGDYVDMLALFDTLSVPIICGSESAVNNYESSPVRLQVFEASPGTLNLVDLIEARLGRYRSQKTPRDFKLQEIRGARELAPDPSYTPEYIPAPARETIEVELSREQRTMLRAVLARGVYPPPEEKTLVACFFQWYARTREDPRYTRLSIRTPDP